MFYCVMCRLVVKHRAALAIILTNLIPPPALCFKLLLAMWIFLLDIPLVFICVESILSMCMYVLYDISLFF